MFTAKEINDMDADTMTIIGSAVIQQAFKDYRIAYEKSLKYTLSMKRSELSKHITEVEYLHSEVVRIRKEILSCMFWPLFPNLDPEDILKRTDNDIQAQYRTQIEQWEEANRV